MPAVIVSYFLGQFGRRQSYVAEPRDTTAVWHGQSRSGYLSDEVPCLLSSPAMLDSRGKILARNITACFCSSQWTAFCPGMRCKLCCHDQSGVEMIDGVSSFTASSPASSCKVAGPFPAGHCPWRHPVHSSGSLSTVFPSVLIHL